MNQIKNIDIIKNKIPNWQISDIAYIKSISLLPNESYKKRFLDITFLSQDRSTSLYWPNESKVFHEILLSFYDVSNLKIKFGDEFITQITGFSITDISDQGWEGINFQIEDYENDVIDFYCKEIEVKYVKQI